MLLLVILMVQVFLVLLQELQTMTLYINWKDMDVLDLSIAFQETGMEVVMVSRMLHYILIVGQMVLKNHDGLGLGVGSYTVTITDCNGCVYSETFFVSASLDPDVFDLELQITMTHQLTLLMFMYLPWMYWILTQLTMIQVQTLMTVLVSIVVYTKDMLVNY